ncbi:hypothetical protein A3721_09315 [Sulfitobacter sp. HI0023]|nr:hypothetical protein A3721_09315 [Sulfitobacter sp. HI0023]
MPEEKAAMSNVIHANFLAQPRVCGAQDTFAALLRSFADHRQPRDDVYWLKENAELLGMLASTGGAIPAEALSPYAAFYDRAPAYLEFFPQYYRFILSICLDLEDLGMGGGHGAALCAQAARNRSPLAELSDLQRGEAQRLLSRRLDLDGDAALRQRLLEFAGARGGFAVPNRKAAYELTHIVFYLSDYGRRDPGLPPEAFANLDDLGLLALLDRDHDLLAEVCLALRHAGAVPDPFWEQEVDSAHGAMRCLPLHEPSGQDDYHPWLVTGWLLRQKGAPAFARSFAGGPLTVRAPQEPPGILRQISRCLYDQGNARGGDWHVMKRTLSPELTREGQDLLQRAEGSSPRFAEFFARFARIPRAA